jgi:hypothetical protein
MEGWYACPCVAGRPTRLVCDCLPAVLVKVDDAGCVNILEAAVFRLQANSDHIDRLRLCG